MNSAYTLLPRYVFERIEPRPEDKGFLPTLVREFELFGRTLSLSIRPVRVKDETAELTSVYPGPLEERVERALRRLAVPENADFKPEHRRLYFSPQRLLEELLVDSGGEASPEITLADARRGLQVLGDASYILTDGEGSVGFHPFSDYSIIRREGLEIYAIQFDSFFLEPLPEAVNKPIGGESPAGRPGSGE